ncbi:MAG: DUF4347 domain-containing protein [Planctomycetales bacterium]|nr:DUF4347 domain-containing protein [Planctomycetales bacterium]
MSLKRIRQSGASVRSSQWSIRNLEKREMLAADVANVDLASCESVDGLAVEGSVSGPTQLVFVDSTVEGASDLIQGLSSDCELVLLDGSRSGIEQLSHALTNRTNVASIHIVSHGKAGQLQLGNQLIDADVLRQHADQIRRWNDSLRADADILLYGCDAAQGSNGTDLLQTLAQLTGADVAGSTDKTGSEMRGGDWELESRVGLVETPLAFHAQALADYQHTLPITIFAAGARGEESMELQIDGNTVATWDNVGGDPGTRTFLSFTYEADGIDADQIRVAFTNDLYQPDQGIDRNLVVDRIEVDGTAYESEAIEVFSTGTWLPADGVTPGFRESEFLHANGYFQYAGSNDPGGDDASAIINEIHYNPGPDGAIDGDAEFLELYNPGTDDFDLSGASFTGFDLTFAPGTILAAGQYAIVSPSIVIAEAEWGVTPLAEFAAGGLSGGGETIQLIAADGVTIIDEVTYDDASPWPGAPDGNGPSLELINPNLDNSDPVNWGVSNPAPTPAAQNSVYSEGPVSDISDITINPGQPLPNQAFTISATIADATVANLTYKIGFGADQVVAMTNVGGDVWQATVPGQEAGALVRYRIDSDVAVAPFAGDTINYFGVVVSPTDIVGNTLPVFQWYVDPVQYDELVTDLYLTNTKIPTVIAYGDQVIDNATVRVRGSGSREFPKKGFKFELPDGYLLDFGPLANTPVDEFGIVSDFADWSGTSAQISWEIFNAETDSLTSTFFTRVEQNGDFYGVYRFQELYDGTWRTANGFDDGQFYQAEEGAFSVVDGFDKKEPDDGDYTPILAVRDVLLSAPSSSKTAWLYDNVDIPAAINHMALSVLVRHYDQFYHNFYVAQDGSTERWSVVEWDLDLTWRDAYAIGSGLDVITPDEIGAEFMDAIWEVPEFQAMYWQRLQTLVDKYLGNDGLIDRRAELIAEIGTTNSALDVQEWGRADVSGSYWTTEWQQAINARRAIFANESRLPGGSLTNPNIVINELHYNPAGTDAEFIELYNASSQAVDLSGWQIDGVGLTIASGTVILPGDYVVFTDADSQFRNQTVGNIYVGGQYSGGLSGGGEAITLFDANGNIIDEVTYDDAAPWPTEPDGNGFSLALLDPALDNSVASNWAASSFINGTPGRLNVFGEVTETQIRVFATGATTNEIIQLEIAGEIVATFNVGDYGAVIGDYDARNFVEMSYTSLVPVVASDVRINFINDTYDPANGIDYNVRVDRIEIGTDVYETEAPTVYASGTWVSGVGITEGFLLTDTLHANGYFQYDA